MPHTTGFAAPSTRWLWSCQCPENEKKHDLRNERSAFWFRTAPTSWQGWDSNGQWHFTQVVKLYMRTIFSLQAILVDMCHPQDIDSDLFPPTRWLLTCASPTASFIACTPTVQSAIESIPWPWPKLYTLKGWRWNDMTNIKHDQTWSNMIKHDMFKTCSSVKHVFTLSVFHSYFVHISFIFHSYYIYIS